MSTLVEDERMGELEFEQKYILDSRKCDKMLDILSHLPNIQTIHIKQFYDDGMRYRLSATPSKVTAHRENKKSIKIPVSYSVSLEQTPEMITADEFMRKFAKSKKRLTKLRYQWDSGENQKVMVDFFQSFEGKRVVHFQDSVYAVVAEVETILNADTLDLNLRLPLPDVLVPFLIKKVDAREASSKVFKSANMIDMKDNIAQIEKALAELYEPA